VAVGGRPVGILGTGMCIPERVLTNKDLEKIVDTSDEWIFERTGIRERRIAEPGTTASSLAVSAAEMALEAAGISPENIGLVVVATVTPDMIFPATACMVQDRIGAPDAAAFDLEAGCTGFIYSLACASQFVATGTCDYALVIGSETISKLTDWQDRNTCVLFGDGAGAVVIGPVPDGYGILGLDLGSKGSGSGLLTVPAGGSACPASESSVREKLHFIRMDGSEVFKFAVRIIGDSSLNALNAAGLSREDVDFLVPHQANMRIIKAGLKRLRLPENKACINIEKYGNTSSASVPIALHEAVTDGRIQDENIVLMTAFGAGLTWGSVVMRWSSGLGRGGERH